MKFSVLSFFVILSLACSTIAAELQEEDIDNPNAQQAIQRQAQDSTRALESTGATNIRTDTFDIRESASTKEILTDSIEIVNDEDAVLQKYYRTRAKKTVITITNREPAKTITFNDNRSYGGIITGSCLFGSSYALAILAAISAWDSDPKVGTSFLIPCVGPLVAVIASPPGESSLTSLVTILCAGWSAAETIGALLIIKTAYHNSTVSQQRNPDVSFSPDIAPGKIGLTMKLRFEPF